MNGQTTEAKTVLDQGYLIVRGAIDPEQLEPVRATAELFLDRARERSRGDPNVGWDAHRVPHPALYDFVDRDTAILFDPLVSDRVLDVNRRLMDAPEAGLNTASLFTEPHKPLGKIFQWHRDSVLRPSSPLPLSGLQAGWTGQANAPGVLSWNIALHDDDSLWVVPGSKPARQYRGRAGGARPPGAARRRAVAGSAPLRACRRRCRGVRRGDGPLRQQRRESPPAHVQRRLPGVRRAGAGAQSRHLLEGGSLRIADPGDGGAVRAFRTACWARSRTRSRAPSGPSSNETGSRSGNTWHGCIPDGSGAWSAWCSFTRSRTRSGSSPGSARKLCPTPTTRPQRWTTPATGGAPPRSWSASPGWR